MNMAQLRLKYDGREHNVSHCVIERHANKNLKLVKPEMADTDGNASVASVEKEASSFSNTVAEKSTKNRYDGACTSKNFQALTLMLPEEARPRERLAKFGAKALLDEELLAIMLRTGSHGKNVLMLARQLINSFGSLPQLMNAGVEELKSYGGIGEVKAIELAAMLELSRRVMLGDVDKREVFSEPEKVARRVNLIKANSQTESFFVFPLDKRCRLCTKQPIEISTGILDASLVHPREVFREAIRYSAALIILAHNHPSGDPRPSRKDIEITKDLVAAGQQLSIPIVDHVVVGAEEVYPSGFFSMHRENIIAF